MIRFILPRPESAPANPPRSQMKPHHVRFVLRFHSGAFVVYFSCVHFSVLPQCVVNFLCVHCISALYRGGGGVGWVVRCIKDRVSPSSVFTSVVGFIHPRPESAPPIPPKPHHVRFVLRCRLLSILFMSVFPLRCMTDAVGWGGWVVVLGIGFLLPRCPKPHHVRFVLLCRLCCWFCSCPFSLCGV